MDNRTGAPLFSTDRLIIESDYFDGLTYEMRDDHVIIRAGKAGVMAIQRRNGVLFAEELLVVMQEWEGIRT